MRKKAMTNNGPEGRDQEVILDPVRAFIVSPNDLEKITEPKGVPGEVGRVSEREGHCPCTSLREGITI